MARGRLWRGLALVALLVLVLIQLVPVERTNPPEALEITAPPEVAAVLRRSCYDCHSNRTRWPWYAWVAPLSWFVADHVEAARGDLNFTEWPAFDPEAQEYFLGSIQKQLEEGRMPLRSYLLLHPDARLDAAEIDRVTSWAEDESLVLREVGFGWPPS